MDADNRNGTDIRKVSDRGTYSDAGANVDSNLGSDVDECSDNSAGIGTVGE